MLQAALPIGQYTREAPTSGAIPAILSRHSAPFGDRKSVTRRKQTPDISPEQVPEILRVMATARVPLRLSVPMVLHGLAIPPSAVLKRTTVVGTKLDPIYTVLSNENRHRDSGIKEAWASVLGVDPFQFRASKEYEIPPTTKVRKANKSDVVRSEKVLAGLQSLGVPLKHGVSVLSKLYALPLEEVAKTAGDHHNWEEIRRMVIGRRPVQDWARDVMKKALGVDPFLYSLPDELMVQSRSRGRPKRLSLNEGTKG
jgi:hypothetical protein